ncbi:stress responsive A/B barrel domain-containing protein [Saccharata proteae CBS 121410]|uniref:Stress responsive A/B barrel domain-containing protein n=1 Tax=Saccharata proteae CBS 121410 TaxID=1314787 RepID=A0A6A5YCM1_9PEZI|nr:stress responsive A/B barrel domain-containing protein [Saccharata proteae CBS 121410]
MPIKRITLFKVPNADDIPAVLDKYTTLAQDAKKDNTPYILSARASQVIEDPAGRNQGYTVCAQTLFADLEDMKFYDVDCEAHKAIKAFLKPKAQGVMTVYMEEGEGAKL